jgi:hypothetical protein
MRASRPRRGAVSGGRQRCGAHCSRGTRARAAEAIGCYPFILYTYGKVEIQFLTLLRRPPFDRDEMREELRSRLNAIPGVDLPPDRLARRPTFELKALYAEGALQVFLGAMGWVFDEVAAAEGSALT